MKVFLVISFICMIFIVNLNAQDFKVAPNSVFPTGSNCYNVSIASDTNNGFFITKGCSN